MLIINEVLLRSASFTLCASPTQGLSRGAVTVTPLASLTAVNGRVQVDRLVEIVPAIAVKQALGAEQAIEIFAQRLKRV